MSQISEQVIELSHSQVLDFCGANDEKLRDLEGRFAVRIVPRGNTLKLIGPADDVSRAREVLAGLLRGVPPPPASGPTPLPVETRHPTPPHREAVRPVFGERVPIHLKKRTVAAMTAGQKRYIEAIQRADIVFGIGPAGTGKTYLAMAMAVSALLANQVRRIVLVRPAVEAGEKLGFLPGDISAKFDPFVRPLYDALNDMMEPERGKMLLENGVIEIAPLAFMRGRTLNSAFVILDEGQNTTIEQMKMFLTRLGFDSKAVITGDITQVDLPNNRESGLVDAQRILRQIQGIEFVEFSERDVVRHELVQKIVRAYERRSSGPQQPELPLEGTGVQAGPHDDSTGAAPEPVVDTLTG